MRDETDADVDAITAVTFAAFQTLEISDDTEHLIILALRAADALTLSLVAELKGEVVGHIAFSPVTISATTSAPTSAPISAPISRGAKGEGSGGEAEGQIDDWYGLGPVSVLPKFHRQGIGSALIAEGLSRLKRLGGVGCCVVGDPRYYPRFGFTRTDELIYDGAPPEVFFALPFCGPIPAGKVIYHEAFEVDG